MKIVLVYNPRSGKAFKRNDLRKRCEMHGIDIEHIIEVEDGYEKRVKKLAQEGRVIAVIGGDGTLSSVANIIIGTPAIFAPLSGGTLNHFTKDLGISQDLDEALENLKKAKSKKIDAASVNGTVFINNSSIGLYPLSLQTREELEQHNVSKWLAAIIASAKALARYRIFTVTINGETFKTPFLFVGNNDYHITSRSKFERTNLTGGTLSVYTVATASRLELIKLLCFALIGKLRQTKEFKTWHPTKLTVHTKRPRVRVARDGELEKLDTPLEYKALVGALRVIGSS